MVIATTFQRFPDPWTAASGETGRSHHFATLEQLLARLRETDLVLIDDSPDLTMRLGAYFFTRPWKRKPLVAVDQVLRKPRGFADRLVKRWMLGRVDHFIHYFKDLTGYERYFGIGPERSSFVPFKPNLRDRHESLPNPNGEYVLGFGRSLRDWDTFFDAAEMLPYPSAIPEPNWASLNAHGSRFTRTMEQLPRNVARLPDDGGQESQIRILQGAKVVVLPILKDSLLSGIGTYLNAMYMGKCVIASHGPGMSDVLTNGQALLVEPENPKALAETIRRAWEDSELRECTARRGHEYALSLGGEPQLFQRILDQAVKWYRAR